MDQVLDSNAQTNVKDTRWENKTRKKERKKSFAEKWKLIAGIFSQKNIVSEKIISVIILQNHPYLPDYIHSSLLLLSNKKHVPCFYRGIEAWVEAWENEKC